MKNQDTHKERIYFIDNIRWLMIIFVVLMHINVTYSSMGRWYYTEPIKLDLISTIFFAMYGSFTQAYFMGLLFLIAGYFVPSSIDRKGEWKFIINRFFRLGIPTLIFMLILHPLTMMMLNSSFNFLNPENYIHYLMSLEFIGKSGPLWFAFVLLIFSIIYVLIKIILMQLSPRNKRKFEDKDFISHKNIFFLALLISIIAFIVRLRFPLGGAILNMQIGFFTQYVVLFFVGIIAHRYNLFAKIPYRTGINWFKSVLFAGIPLWLIIVIFGRQEGFNMFGGGFNWQSATFALWESFFCIGICLGLIVLYRDKINNQNQISKFLSDNAFGVFVFHAPILVLFTLVWKNWQVYPILKWFITALIVVPICFIFVSLLRKIPGMKQLFS
jgi:glucans biosynthesis protein C